MLAVCVTFSIRSGMLDAFAAGAGSSDMFKIEIEPARVREGIGRGGAGVRGADGLQALAMNLAVRRMEAHEEPCFGGCDGGLPVFCQAPAAPEPGERALHDPSPGDDDEAGDPIGALDDLDDRTVGFLHGALQLLAGIAAVGEQMDQRRKAFAGRGDERGAPSRS